jgi:ABC-type transporter Mla subunit MlaD
MTIQVRKTLENAAEFAQQLEKTEKNSREVKQVGVVLSTLVAVMDELDRRLQVLEQVARKGAGP